MFSSKISRAKFATYIREMDEILSAKRVVTLVRVGAKFSKIRDAFSREIRRGRKEEGEREREREQKEIRRSRRRGIFLWTVEQPPCDYPGRGAYMSNLYSARSSVSKFEST